MLQLSPVLTTFSYFNFAMSCFVSGVVRLSEEGVENWSQLKPGSESMPHANFGFIVLKIKDYHCRSVYSFFSSHRKLIRI